MLEFIILSILWFFVGYLGVCAIVFIYETEGLLSIDEYRDAWEDVQCPTYKYLTWRILWSFLGPLVFIGVVFGLFVCLMIFLISLPIWDAEFWDKNVCD